MFEKTKLRVLGEWIDRAGPAVLAGRTELVRNSSGRIRLKVDLVTGGFLIGIERGLWIREPLVARIQPSGHEGLAPAMDLPYVMCALLVDEVWRTAAAVLLPVTDEEQARAEAALAVDPAAPGMFRATMDQAEGLIRVLLTTWERSPKIANVLRAILVTQAGRVNEAATYANARS